MSFFPEHRCYVESFGGAAGILLQKQRSYAEVYNDLDGSVVSLFRVLRDPVARESLIEACTLTPYARAEFDLAYQPTNDPIEAARRVVVRAQMGFGSAGATKSHTGFRIDTNRDYGTAQQLWAEYPEALRDAGQRLIGVLIENRPAIEVILQHDQPDTLHYVDPPYLHSTRVLQANKAGYYRYEMNNKDHSDLLDLLCELEGMVVLSGYNSEMYGSRLKGWEIHQTTARIAAGRGTALRTETVWLNPACSAALHRYQPDLFSGQATAA